MQGVIEAYEIVAKMAAPLGLMTFTKCIENGKIPYACWSEKYSWIHFENKLSILERPLARLVFMSASLSKSIWVGIFRY